MSAKDQYIDLCEARVEALEKELSLLTDWIVRDKELNNDWSRDTTMSMFNAYKENLKNEQEN